MKAEIDTAHAADAPGLARLAARTLVEAWSPLALRGMLERPGARALTARVDGAVAGFVLGLRVADEVEIFSLAVDPDWQRRGLGRRLLGDYLGRMRAEGAARVTLEVRASNEPARALYRRAGFRREGQRRRYYADGEDALLLGAAL